MIAALILAGSLALTPAAPVHHDLYRGTQAQAKAEALYQIGAYGWRPSVARGGAQWKCLVALWSHESGWRWNSNNGDGYGTWGIPQAHPGRKMSSAGRDWRTNTTTQIRWGLRYIRGQYGTPCNAWSRWQGRAASGSYGWY